MPPESSHNKSPLEGVVPVLPTPFDDRERIDVESLHRLIEFCIRSGLGAVALPAYGSEFYKLTDVERLDVVAEAVRGARGRIAVVAQCNSASAQVAAAWASRCEDLGAAAIATALPRIFPLGEAAQLRYATAVATAVKIPLLIQDFNPGGPTVGAEFCRRLSDSCPNFRWIKLEESGMGGKVRSIRQATEDRVGVLEGWGGLYLMELIPAGICGVMPGTPMADLFHLVYRTAAGGDLNGAMRLFAPLTPYLNFSLQSMEIFHHIEKPLCVRRGLIRSACVREPTVNLDASSLQYAELLLDQVCGLIEEAGLPLRPLGAL